MPNVDAQPTKLIWMDLEMTGLDPNTQCIIEVACIITDFRLRELDSYHQVIHQPDVVLDKAEDWPKQNLVSLFAESRASSVSEGQVETDILQLIDKHFGDEVPILAGNSIHQDRRFIATRWQKLNTRLHYRMLDVSSFKVWVQGTMGEKFAKTEQHRALGDIQESIAELRWLLKKLK